MTAVDLFLFNVCIVQPKGSRPPDLSGRMGQFKEISVIPIVGAVYNSGDLKGRGGT